jgi:TolA-binding protein
MKRFPSKTAPETMRTHRRVLALMVISLAMLLLPLGEAYGQWFLFGRAQRHYRKCVELYEAKQRAEARECIHEFFSEYPHSRWVEHLQFLDADMETNVNEAMVKFRRFLIEFPTGPYSAKAGFSLAEIYELKGDLAGALKHYSQVYLHPEANGLKAEAGLRMAKCMLLNGDTQSAKRHLEVYLAIYRDEPWRTRARELHADALYQEGEFLQAQNEYRGIISDIPSPEQASPRCYIRIAEIYEDSGDYDAAFQAYRRFLTVFSDAIQRQSAERKVAELASRLKVDLSVSDRAHIVEAGIFKAEPEAMGLIARLRKLGYKAYVVTRKEDHGEVLSVRLGPYESRDSALAVADRLNKEAGLKVTLLPQGGLF